MIKKLSLKECWIYGKEDLIPESRTFKKCLASFIERKACNTAFYYYNINKKPNLFDYVDMQFWSFIEFRLRKIINNYLWK